MNKEEKVEEIDQIYKRTEHYGRIQFVEEIDKLQLEIINLQNKLGQKNQQLEDVELSREIASGHRKEVQDEELRQRKLKEEAEKQGDLYKSVLGEIREKLLEFNDKYKVVSGIPFDVKEIFEMIEIIDKVLGDEK